MIGAITLIIGAAVFFTGFVTGTAYAPIKPQKQRTAAHRKGSVILNEEYHNFLTYDGNIKE